MNIEVSNVIVGDTTVGSIEELRLGNKRMPKRIFMQIPELDKHFINIGANAYRAILLWKNVASLHVMGYVILNDKMLGYERQIKNYLIYDPKTNELYRSTEIGKYSNKDYVGALLEKEMLLGEENLNKQLYIGA